MEHQVSRRPPGTVPGQALQLQKYRAEKVVAGR